jgi:hypothetical protein
MGASTSHNPMGLHGLLQGQFYIFFLLISVCKMFVVNTLQCTVVGGLRLSRPSVWRYSGMCYRVALNMETVGSSEMLATLADYPTSHAWRVIVMRSRNWMDIFVLAWSCILFAPSSSAQWTSKLLISLKWEEGTICQTYERGRESNYHEVIESAVLCYVYVPSQI